MVVLKKKKIKGHPYYYLEHSYRKNGQVKKKQRYLGTSPPNNILQLKKQFFLEFHQDTWFTQFDAIKRNYTKEKKNRPSSQEKKSTEQFAIRFTYNTNRIEGSTLTLRETAILLEQGITPTRRPIQDIKETEAHKKIFTDMIAYTKEISLPTLLHWHRELFKETKEDIAGKIRDYNVDISGSTYTPPYAIELDLLLTEFFDWYRNNRKKIHPVQLAALVHLKFVSIHPFGDGNGRISRLFVNAVLNRNGYPMLIIDYTQRTSYYHALERSQLTQDETIFTKWFFRKYLKQYRKHLK
ncbi:MAG: Fic family protein [Candidatus Thermoplasmatota archaeon]|nr:Fic family protein [Candidatus Thermoplasmatota archaeon]